MAPLAATAENSKLDRLLKRELAKLGEVTKDVNSES